MQRTAIITGASGGLGRVLAKEFVQSGWQVIGTGRSQRPSDLPKEVKYEQFDASDPAAVDSFWQHLITEWSQDLEGIPDEICLVNNAGSYIGGGLTELTPKQYDEQMRSSYFTAVYMTKGLANIIAKARIINIISSSALVAHKNNSAYGAAKAAEMHFFQSLQKEFRPDTYQITNLYPSDIASDGPRPNAMTPEDLARFVREQAEQQTSYYLSDVTIYPR